MGSMKKGKVMQLIIDHLHEEELVSDDEGDIAKNSAVSLKKLELQERAKEREAEVKLKELQLWGKELEMQLKLKELELSRVPSSSDAPVRETTTTSFDVSKHIKFGPSFSELEVDKYFSHFEKVAQNLKWPKNSWALLSQSSLVYKARDVYSALSVEDSGQYEVVKMSILKAYELVPEAYRQKFRNTKKTEKQTYMEFEREKEMLFDHWCLSKEVNEDYL